MTIVVGVIGAALLFGVFAALRPSDRDDRACNGNCIGCARNGACESEREGGRR